MTAERPRASATAPSPETAPPTGGGGEIRALTGLRIVAAAWVVLFHFHFTALPGVQAVSDLVEPVVTAGALGVDLFFVLSGFVIAHTYLDKLGPRLRARAAGRFVWARACRIWPAYMLIFTMFGIWLVSRAAYGVDPEVAFQAVQPQLTVGEWLQQVFMVQLWDNRFFDGASWVGSTWSISAEWLAYLLFPLVAVVAYRMRNLPAGVLGAGAVALMLPIAVAYAETGSPYYPWSWLVRILCGFGGGVLAYLAVRKLRASPRARRIASPAATAVPVLIVAGLVAGEYAGSGRGGVVIALFPVLVGALALADPAGRGLARLLSTRTMVQGGRISYALYLVHIPMFEVFWLALRRYGGFGGSSLLAPGRILTHLVALAVLLGTLVAAHLLFRYVEEPARAAMKDQPARWGAWLRSRRPVGYRAEAPVAETVRAGSVVIDTAIASRDPETWVFPVVAPGRQPLVASREPAAEPVLPTEPEPVSSPAIPAPSGPATGPQPAVSPGIGGAGAAVPAQRPVERVVQARRAQVRSPHPQLAEDLVGARARGRHRARRDQPHPHIAGQRGPGKIG